jgi:thiopurine S-methyltransferase
MRRGCEGRWFAGGSHEISGAQRARQANRVAELGGRASTHTMDHSFWHERWRSGQIGFHLGSAHPALVRCYERALTPGSRVFVPLCGKTVDLVWLHDRGAHVVGAELSSLALNDFFREHGLTPEIEPRGALTRYRAANIELWLGDVFSLDRATLGTIDGYYDRAALVALPPTLRERYVAHLTSLLPSGTRGLLVSFDYVPAVGGPPFSVPESEIRRLFEPSFSVELLERVDILADEPRFRERGMTSLHEIAYALVRH